MRMSLEKGLNLVATTMNNSVDSPKTNTEIMVISTNEIRNLTSDELESLYNSVQQEGDS
jgi:acetolactate synthase regulatory subunit